MNLRNLSIVVTLLVLLSAGVWFARRPAPPASADPRVGQPVLPADIAERVARVTIAEAGRSVELLRGADGTWTVPSYHDLPADFSKLSRLIADLGESKIRRLVTARPESLARLEFKDTAVSLADGSGEVLWQLKLGKTAEGGGRFLRYGDETKAYLAPLNLWLDPEPKNWADPVLLDLKASDIARVEIGFPEGESVVATREKPDGPWASPSAPQEQRLKPDRVDAALSGLLTIRFTDTLAPDDPQVAAAKPHSRTVRLTAFSGPTYTLTFSRKPEAKQPKPAATAGTPAPAAPGETGTDAPKSSAAEPPKPAEPEMETIPAGPVFVAISTSNETARINTLMRKRAFQIGEWTYTGLPQSAAEFWEPAGADVAK